MADKKPIEITRYQVITPVKCEPDEYGNLLVIGSEGEEVKVNKKHESLHDGFYNAMDQERAVKVGFAVYMDKEYVHTAAYYGGEPADTTPEPASNAPQSKSKPMVAQTREIAPQELGMWWKEVGECLRSGTIKEQYPNNFAHITKQYFDRMWEVTGIRF